MKAEHSNSLMNCFLIIAVHLYGIHVVKPYKQNNQYHQAK